jgi:hypothetical protein
MLSSVSPKVEGWMKAFFIDVLMTGFGLSVYFNFFATPGEEPSPISGSFSFGALSDHLIVIFLGSIIIATQNKPSETV